MTLSFMAHVASSADLQAHPGRAQHGKNGSYLAAGHTAESSWRLAVLGPGAPVHFPPTVDGILRVCGPPRGSARASTRGRFSSQRPARKPGTQAGSAPHSAPRQTEQGISVIRI